MVLLERLLTRCASQVEKQRNQDEQNWKAQMDAVHDVLDTKVNEKPFEDLKHCVASLTKGVVKFAQVVGVFPGPRFDDTEGADATEADIELLGWEDCAENMSFRVDKACRSMRACTAAALSSSPSSRHASISMRWSE